MMFLKLPILGLFWIWIVWWAVKADPETGADDAAIIELPGPPGAPR